MRPVMPRWTLRDILWPWGRIRRLRAALAQAIADNECLHARCDRLHARCDRLRARLKRSLKP
jgi:hypothetical protein